MCQGSLVLIKDRNRTKGTCGCAGPSQGATNYPMFVEIICFLSWINQPLCLAFLWQKTGIEKWRHLPPLHPTEHLLTCRLPYIPFPLLWSQPPSPIPSFRICTQTGLVPLLLCLWVWTCHPGLVKQDLHLGDHGLIQEQHGVPPRPLRDNSGIIYRN